MYKLILNKTFRYNIIVRGYTKTDSLSFRTKDFFTIIADWVTLRKANAVINIPIAFKAPTTKLRGKMQSVIKFFDSKMVITSKLIGKMSVDLLIALPIEVISKIRMKLRSVVETNVSFAFTLIVGRFFALYEHDPKTLGTMDAFTLNELDYIEI